MALPRGRHDLTSGEVAADQRRRMLDAVGGALAEHGYARMTVSDVLECAGVSRRTFYEQFEDLEACFFASYDDAERRAWVAAAEAVAAVPADNWPSRMHAALRAVLEFVASEPDTARLFTLEARAAGPEMATRHAAALDRVAATLREGNRRADPVSDAPRSGPADADSAPHPDLPETTERTLVANVAALVGSYVISGATELLPGLEPQLGEHLLAPYREAA
jgi:AcrR family transcriptional regulator